MGVYAGGGSRSRRARPKNGPKLLCRGGGPADAAQQAVSRGVRKCDSLAQAAGLPQQLAQAGSGGLEEGRGYLHPPRTSARRQSPRTLRAP